MKKEINRGIKCGMGILVVVALFFQLPVHKVQAAESSENVVVCIDPGHGGSNQGAMYNGYEEKDLTLQIANAMYNELSQYEGVSIVMTRTQDVDVSLTQRAEIAANAGADFLYSIHLNASSEHNLYGAEVWTSGFGEQYAEGKTFGEIELAELGSDIGVYTKGVKTKISDKGDYDYYSVINQAKLRGVTAAIIEHCYMDEAHDDSFYSSTEALTELGKADATAVAKYYGLKSTSLGVDYSTYDKTTYTATDEIQRQDTTAPEVSQICLNSYDATTRTVDLHVTASDSESKIIYYSYSCDGGATWSALCGWTADTEGDIQFTLDDSSTGDICVNVWNLYNLSTTSNHIVLP